CWARSARWWPAASAPCWWRWPGAASFRRWPSATGSRLPSSTGRLGREPIRAPSLAAHAVVHEEQTAGVVLVFHRQQPGIVRSPERTLPVRLEEIALG